MEVNGKPVLIDRGMVEYYYAEANELRRSSMHNVLTPVLEDGSFPDQEYATKKIIPYGDGDTVSLNTGIDVSNVWRSYMSRYLRTFISENFEHLEVRDQGSLKKECKVAFHLHALSPFRIEENNITLDIGDHILTIEAPWAKKALSREELINLHYQPVYHLILESGTLRKFDLITHLYLRPRGKEEAVESETAAILK